MVDSLTNRLSASAWMSQALGRLGESAHQVVHAIARGVQVAVSRARAGDERRVGLAIQAVAAGRGGDDRERMSGSLRSCDIAAHAARRYAQLVGQLARRDPAIGLHQMVEQALILIAHFPVTVTAFSSPMGSSHGFFRTSGSRSVGSRPAVDPDIGCTPQQDGGTQGGDPMDMILVVCGAGASSTFLASRMRRSCCRARARRDCACRQQSRPSARAGRCARAPRRVRIWRRSSRPQRRSRRHSVPAALLAGDGVRTTGAPPMRSTRRSPC